MGKSINYGRCFTCSRRFSKLGMSRHLKGCAEKSMRGLTEFCMDENAERIFQILIEARDAPEYWLFIDINAEHTLADLDSFLRKVWLECCNHLSAFRIFEEWFASPAPCSSDPGPGEMDVPLADVVGPGDVFHHVYDFSCSTFLRLKIVREFFWSERFPEILMVARNEPLNVTCQVCKNSVSMWICSECMPVGPAWLCKRCAMLHSCDKSKLLPVLNSPRTGICNYRKPAI